MPAVMLPQVRRQLPPLPVFRFSVDQYHRMSDCGILSREDPVELLDGLVVIKGQSTLAPLVQVGIDNGNAWNVPLPIRRFSVDEYHRLIQEGIVSKEKNAELVEGWLLQKMTRNPPDDVAVALALKYPGENPDRALALPRAVGDHHRHG